MYLSVKCIVCICNCLYVYVAEIFNTVLNNFKKYNVAALAHAHAHKSIQYSY